MPRPRPTTDATTWLVTRDVDDSESVVASLRAAGVSARAVPALAFETIPWSSSIPGQGEVPILFVTSRRALDGWTPSGVSGARAGVVVAALAPSTAAALGLHGLAADVTATRGAVALAQELVRRWREEHRGRASIDYPTSDAGRRAPEQAAAVAILESIGRVQRPLAYATAVDPLLDERIRGITEAALGWVFASPSAVDAVYDTVSAAGTAPRTRHVVCLGHSTLKRYETRAPAGFPPATLATPGTPLVPVLARLDRSTT